MALNDRLVPVKAHNLARMATVIQRCERMGVEYEVLRNGAIRIKQQGKAERTAKGLTSTARCMEAHARIRGVASNIRGSK